MDKIIGILSAIFLIAWIWVILTIVNSYLDITSKRESKIGEKVIFNGDTLQIIDYSFINSTYTLSNGRVVNYKLIDK